MCIIVISGLLNMTLWSFFVLELVGLKLGMRRYKNMYIGRSPMQNRTDSGIPRFSTPQTNMDVSSSRHRNKSGQMHEI